MYGAPTRIPTEVTGLEDRDVGRYIIGAKLFRAVLVRRRVHTGRDLIPDIFPCSYVERHRVTTKRREYSVQLSYYLLAY